VHVRLTRMEMHLLILVTVESCTGVDEDGRLVFYSLALGVGTGPPSYTSGVGRKTSTSGIDGSIRVAYVARPRAIHWRLLLLSTTASHLVFQKELSRGRIPLHRMVEHATLLIVSTIS
jgi:hypothetical protein